MLDPHTASVCSPAEIKKMTLDLFAAEKKFLPAISNRWPLTSGQRAVVAIVPRAAPGTKLPGEGGGGMEMFRYEVL